MNPVHLRKASDNASILLEENTAGRTTMECLRTNRFLPRRNPSVVDQCDNRSDCGRRAGRPAVDGDGAIIDIHKHVSIIVMNQNQ